ncbi:hypothetical protein [Desulfovibrio desulfuricans]|uniref:hypothetical protein n=1 Tax=Desulfovibrio desulfuricans TaxID=876 RepID=UPI0003B5D114|nr:hypothetical protein [Desulfovibrio desulfuricans]MDD3683161.1 hypothetical protein [Desulfovibrio desulfuricans]QTO40455.1 hypothetical protein J8J02_00530 [Desulfovibrio desulfuricans]
MAKNIDCTGAGFLPCAFIMGFAAASLLALCLLPPAASAREIAEVDSPAWCARYSSPARTQGKEQDQAQAQAECLRLEAACRSVLPDLAPAASCPDRQLDRCVAQQRDGGSWCAILCCFDPDAPACRTAAASIPAFLAMPKR